MGCVNYREGMVSALVHASIAAIAAVSVQKHAIRCFSGAKRLDHLFVGVHFQGYSDVSRRGGWVVGCCSISFPWRGVFVVDFLFGVPCRSFFFL